MNYSSMNLHSAKSISVQRTAWKSGSRGEYSDHKVSVEFTDGTRFEITIFGPADLELLLTDDAAEMIVD